MAAADHVGPDPDLYQLLGVPWDASQGEIAQAWRRRARDEHPDVRPADADAPGRFRALAAAWRVLGDPARRAAYDHSLARAGQPTAPITVRHRPGPGVARGTTPPVRVAGPPLRAGPVRVEGGPGPAPQADSGDEDAGLAVLDVLALRYLARDQDRPWLTPGGPTWTGDCFPSR
jgi:curved DNA-binding protein CbpA